MSFLTLGDSVACKVIDYLIDNWPTKMLFSSFKLKLDGQYFDKQLSFGGIARVNTNIHAPS